jgi:hypothetical protein
LNAHIAQVARVEVGQHRDRQQLEPGALGSLLTAFDGRPQGLSIGMHRQELHAHLGHQGGGASHGFLDIQELQIQEHTLPAGDRPAHDLRSGRGIELQPDLDEADSLLHTIQEPLGFIGRGHVQSQNQTVPGVHVRHRFLSHFQIRLTGTRPLCYKAASFQPEDGACHESFISQRSSARGRP